MKFKTHLDIAKNSIASDAPSENKALHDNINIIQNKQYMQRLFVAIYEKKTRATNDIIFINFYCDRYLSRPKL